MPPVDDAYVYPNALSGLSDNKDFQNHAQQEQGQSSNYLVNRISSIPAEFLEYIQNRIKHGIQNNMGCVVIGLAGWFLAVMLMTAFSTMLVPVALPVLLVGFLCGTRAGFLTGLMVMPGFLLLRISEGVAYPLIWSAPLDIACMTILGGCGALCGYMRQVINRQGAVMKETARQEAQIRIHQMRLRALNAQMALENERQRYGLARNILEEMETTFTAVKQNISRLADPDERRRHETGLAIEEDLLNLQTRVATISPPMLYNAGLEATLGKLAGRIEKQSNLSIQFNFRFSEGRIKNEIVVLIFQAVSELFENVIKHAKATNVELEAGTEGADLKISVRDNGQGFDMATLKALPYDDSGFGLFAVKEKIAHVGGTFEIESETETGTWATLILPLDNLTE